MREKLGKLLNNLKSKREDKIIARYQSYYSDNLSHEQLLKLDEKYWNALNYGIDACEHADIEYYCIAYAQSMKNDNLYLWYYESRYFWEIFKWKIKKII